MSQRNKGTDWSEVGCIAIIGLFALPYILQALFVALLPYLFVGVAGIVCYRLYVYDKRTGRITKYFEDKFILPDKKNDALLEEESKATKLLPVGDSEELLLLKKEFVELKEQQRISKEQQANEINKAIKQHTDIIGLEKKSEVLDDIFGKKTSNYSRSDEFEKQQFQEANKKKKDNLDLREINQNINEKLLEQDKKIFESEVKINTRIDGVESRVETGFLEFAYKLLHLEKDLTTFKGLVAERFTQVESNFQKALNAVQEQVTNLRVEVKQDMSDMKVQFGNEIVRIDKQQMTLLDKMRQYENQIKSFSIDVQKIKIEAEKFAIRGERMLNMSSTLYQRHKTEMQGLSKDLAIGLQQMALHKGDFANKVGQAKLMLDEISQDQYFALKDMAYERVGINMLRQEHQQRANLEEQKLQNLINKKQGIEDKIRMRESHGREVAALKHQLFMVSENLQFTRNRASLMQQEYAVMQRLSR